MGRVFVIPAKAGIQECVSLALVPIYLSRPA